ncbi:hypothetical protein RD792_017006 [Penstemon davidsonii]|uniref:Cytochrome P450 n=1 Tax=Penstemon davidsonii TaxID=160366 RepID=A0ABR0CM15_9LAMI|nr:hypothetical protein RD792_017006 [Penstemon davidsonii]
MDMMVTSDPANINHILTKNFSNYPKGPEFRKIFEILGDGIINAESELWEFHRRAFMVFMNHVKYYDLLETLVWEKVENGLFPVLDYFSEHGTDVDLQDIFQRLAFDNICKLVLDYDPSSLCIDLPYIPSEKAFNDTMDAMFYRYVLPERIWKLQKWLGIGKEKKLTEAWKAFDEFIYPLIDQPLKKDGTCLTWLFWLIATNPLVEVKIREEIKTILHLDEAGKKWRFFNVKESHKLVYLHGALCESLRLFPPIALQQKTSIHSDILPSGHYVDENTRVILSFYSVGRMETVWGKDCLEFKPERWISEHGGIKHVPSYKFPAFNVGPRTCLGKNTSIIQLKMIAASIIYNYDVQLLKGHPVLPRDSVILQAKHGLRVRLSRRNVV